MDQDTAQASRISADSSGDTPFQSRLYRERADSVVQQQFSALPVNCLLGLSTLPMLHKTHGYLAPLVWFGVLLTVNAIRYVNAKIYARSNREDRARLYLMSACVGSTVCGVVWAMVPTFFMDATDPRSLSLLVIVCGVSAGAMVQGAAHVWMSLGFVCPLLVASVVSLFQVGSFESGILAFDVSLFLAFLVRTGFYSQKAFRDTLVLKHRATDLAAGLQELANNDPLTGLPNRAFFSYALTTRLEQAAIKKGTFYLLLVDLDDFKSINDTLGHTAGDIVLKEVAARLSRADGARHAVARLGGDEFAILLMADCDDAMARHAAEQIVSEAGGAFLGCGHPVNIGVSAGLSKFPDDGLTDDDLLARADLALYAAKAAGRQTWRRFDSTLLSAANIARDIEQDLPQALADGSLHVHFQPQVALDGRALIGLEALIRWNHPRHGWLAPPLIVKAAMRLRKSDVLTGHLLDHACRMVKDLAGLGLDNVVVAVNVSPSELSLYSLPALVKDCLHRHGVDGGQLEIEITEDAFVSGDLALSALNAISAMGLRLAIDDFGTGCSSIAYLRTLRVHRIKIDRCFVSGFVERASDHILVQAILGIGRSFGIEVMAEGVETEEEAALLESFGCPLAQGYHFGRPMSDVRLRGWIAARQFGAHETADDALLPIDVAA